MLPVSELKKGDYVIAEYEGRKDEGIVTAINHTQKLACVQTAIQEFWFEEEHLFPIPLNDEQLLKLNFTKEELPDGAIKYKKGAFRLVIPSKDNFSQVEMWYREDKREHPNVHFVHQLQNHYHQMTKVPLTDEPV